MSENASQTSDCSSSRSSSSSYSLCVSEDSQLDRHAKLKRFLLRFVLLPFLQGIMLGLGQHGARYFLSYITRKTMSSTSTSKYASSTDVSQQQAVQPPAID